MVGRFTTIIEIERASLKELKGISKVDFQKCFGDKKKHWHKYITSYGDYFQGDNIDVDELIRFYPHN